MSSTEVVSWVMAWQTNHVLIRTGSVTGTNKTGVCGEGLYTIFITKTAVARNNGSCTTKVTLTRLSVCDFD